MMCLGFEPGAAGWYAQMKPRSYGGRPSLISFWLTMERLCQNIWFRIKTLNETAETNILIELTQILQEI